MRLSWNIINASRSTVQPPANDPTKDIPPRIIIDVRPGARVRNQDGSPWDPVPLTQTMDALGRDMYVVYIVEPYVPGRLEVSTVEIKIDGTTRLQAAYGTERRDTTSGCGDSKSGFGLLFNWNLLGNSTYTVCAFADGIEFDSATFTVTTLGTEFLTGVRRTERLQDFPTRGTNKFGVKWQEALQNFMIAEVE